ncbi:MAG TPA: hydrogenase maturation nickel metallochaperone HypA [Candidatus Binatia bacterium]|nr:hydrogenase maturation nickel metallochaperone HypA [Candidatus Binatia bacterium]
MGIANSMLDAVRAEVERYPGTYPVRVGLRIGEVAAIDQEALKFCFEALTRDTDLERLDLQIEFCPRRNRCPVCGAEFIVREYNVRCPDCGEDATASIGGDELELAFLEVEEYGTCTTGAKSTE